MTGTTGGTDLANQVEDQVLGGDPRPKFPADRDTHRARQLLEQGLGCQYMLHFTGPDPKGQRAERSVRGGMTVTTDDRHPRLGVAQLGTDHVDDSLVGAVQIIKRDTKLLAIIPQRINLQLRDLVDNR